MAERDLEHKPIGRLLAEHDEACWEHVADLCRIVETAARMNVTHRQTATIVHEAMQLLVDMTRALMVDER